MGLEALEGMVNTVRVAPTSMSNAAMQMVHDGLKRHCRAMDLLDIGRVPKHHLCIHLIHNVPLHRNPRTYALFVDTVRSSTSASLQISALRTAPSRRAEGFLTG